MWQLGDRDKATLKAEIKAAEEWLEHEGPAAEHEELEEHLAAFQAAVAPITSKLYGDNSSEDDDSHYGRDPGEF